MGVFAASAKLRDPLWENPEESLWLITRDDLVYEVQDEYIVTFYTAGHYRPRTLGFRKNGYDWQYDSEGDIYLAGTVMAGVYGDVQVVAPDDFEPGVIWRMATWLADHEVLRRAYRRALEEAEVPIGLKWANMLYTAWLRTIAQ
jgi:hypothetical protein